MTRLHLFGLLAICAASTVHAQSDAGQFEVGSKIPKKHTMVAESLAGEARDSYRACWYAVYPEEMGKVANLADPLDEAPIKAHVPRGLFRSETCERYHLLVDNQGETITRVSFSSLRTMMREAAYLDRFDALPGGQYEPAARAFTSGRSDSEQARALAMVSDCLAGQDPEGADALVRTRSGSSEESTAVRALVPALSACLPQGKEFALKPANVRSFAADGLWQRYGLGSKAVGASDQ